MHKQLNIENTLTQQTNITDLNEEKFKTARAQKYLLEVRGPSCSRALPGIELTTCGTKNHNSM